MVVISTAGDNEESPLGQLRTRAYALPILQRNGAYRFASSTDRAFQMHEWGLDASQDLDDLELVKSANPLSTITVKQLRERHDSPSTTSWAWGRFTANAWVSGEHSAIAPQEWDALALHGSTIPVGSPIFVGLDLAWRGPDCTAIVPLFYVSDSKRIIGDPIIFEAPAGGMVTDLEVTPALLDLADRYELHAIVYDPNAGGQALAQQLEREHGLNLVEHSQRDTPMAQADGRLLLAIRQKQLQHSGHRVLRQHVLNAAEKSVAGDMFRFTRPKHGPRVPIDALTALSMCHSTAVAEANTPKRDNSWYMF